MCHYRILTDGSKGTENRDLSPEELVATRHKEQQAALEALGGVEVHFLDYPDGQLQITLELKKDIVKVIRKVKPDVVVTMDPTVVYSASRGFINHPDHRAAGQATLDAVFPLARDHLSFHELFLEGYEPHKTRTVLLTNFDNQNFVMDITATFDKKLEALKSHVSQIKDMERISGWMRESAERAAKDEDFELGEGFMRIDLSI